MRMGTVVTENELWSKMKAERLLLHASEWASKAPSIDSQLEREDEMV
jgi:hypothetical protein